MDSEKASANCSLHVISAFNVSTTSAHQLGQVRCVLAFSREIEKVSVDPTGTYFIGFSLTCVLGFMGI